MSYPLPDRVSRTDACGDEPPGYPGGWHGGDKPRRSFDELLESHLTK
jgi:hypothetical protein